MSGRETLKAQGNTYERVINSPEDWLQLPILDPNTGAWVTS